MQAAKAAKALRDVDLVNISASRTGAEASIEAHEAWMATRYRSGGAYANSRRLVKAGEDDNDINATEAFANASAGLTGDGEEDGDNEAIGLLADMARSRAADKPSATRGEVAEANAELAAMVQDKEELLLETAELQIENARTQALSLQDRNDAGRALVRKYDVGSRCAEPSGFTADRLSDQLQLILYPADVRGYVNPVLRKAAKVGRDSAKNRARKQHNAALVKKQQNEQKLLLLGDRPSATEGATADAAASAVPSPSSTAGSPSPSHPNQQSPPLPLLALLNGGLVIESATTMDEDHTVRTAKELQRLCRAIAAGADEPPVPDTITRGGGRAGGAATSESEEEEGEEDEENENEGGRAEGDDSDIANMNDLLLDDDDDDDGRASIASKSMMNNGGDGRRRSSVSSVKSNGRSEREFAALLDHTAGNGGVMPKGQTPKTCLPRDFHSALRTILELLCEFVLIKNRRIIALKEENAAIAKERVAEQSLLRSLIVKTREEAAKAKERVTKMRALGLADDDTAKGGDANAAADDSQTTKEIRRIRAERKEKDRALELKRRADAKADEAAITAVKEQLVPLMTAFFPSATVVKQTAEDIAAAMQLEAAAKERAALRPPRPLSASPHMNSAATPRGAGTPRVGGGGLGEKGGASSSTPQPQNTSTAAARPRSANYSNASYSYTSAASVVSAASTTAAASARGAVGLLATLSLASLTQLAVKMSGALNMSNVILAQVALTDALFENGLALAEGARADVAAEVRNNRGPLARLSPAKVAEADSKAAEQRIAAVILGGGAASPATPSPRQLTARPQCLSSEANGEEEPAATPQPREDPSGLVDDTAVASKNNNTNENEEDTAAADADANNSSVNAANTTVDVVDTFNVNAASNSDLKPTDVADCEWYESARLEYLKRLDVAMLVTKERLVQMMMLRTDPTDAVAALHREQDEAFLRASTAKAEQQRAMRRLNVNDHNAVSALTTAGGAQQQQAMADVAGDRRGKQRRVSIQLSEAQTSAGPHQQTPIATGIAVTVNGLTTGGPQPMARTNTAASALRWRLEEQRRQAAKEHADAAASIRGVFEKHHKYCHDTLNAEARQKARVLAQITDHDLPLLEDALQFQRRANEAAMSDYEQQQAASYAQMRSLEAEQQQLWAEVAEVLGRCRPLQEERHRLVEEHLMRSDLEWERRRHYEEWCAEHSAHAASLRALRELLEESGAVLQGCRDVHNGMARSIIESVAYQGVQSRRQSRRSVSSSLGAGISPQAAVAYRRASLAASQAGRPPPPLPVPETVGQEVARRLSRVLGTPQSADESLLLNMSGISANNNNGSSRPPTAGATPNALGSAPSTSLPATGTDALSSAAPQYGVTYDGPSGQAVRPMRVPAVPPLERLDMDALFDFEGLLEREDAAADDEEAAMLAEEEALFSSESDNDDDDEEEEGAEEGGDKAAASPTKKKKRKEKGDADLEALLREAAEGDNTRSDALALKALRLDHTHTFLSKLYAPFVHTTHELITRKHARLLIARKSVRLFDDLLGIGSATAGSADNTNANNSANTSYIGGGGGGGAGEGADDINTSTTMLNHNNVSVLSHTSTAGTTGADATVAGEDRDRVRALRREALAAVAALEREVLLLARRVEFYAPMHAALVADLARREGRRAAKKAMRGGVAATTAAAVVASEEVGGNAGDKTARPTSAPFSKYAPPSPQQQHHQQMRPSSAAAASAASAAVEAQYDPIRSAQFAAMALEVSRAVESLKQWDEEEDEALEAQMASVVANYAIYDASETSRLDQRAQSPQRLRSVPRKRPASARGRNSAQNNNSNSPSGNAYSAARITSNISGVSGYNNFYATTSPAKTKAKAVGGGSRPPSAVRSVDRPANAAGSVAADGAGVVDADAAMAFERRREIEEDGSGNSPQLNRTAPAALSGGSN